MPLIRWELARLELKKLCGVRMLYVFFVLCIVFNMQLVLGGRYGEDYVAYVKQARNQAGSRMGDAFSIRLQKLADTKEKTKLLRETAGAEDTFKNYSAAETALKMIGTFRMDGWVAEAMERKYQKQEQRIRALAAQEASMDVGAAGMTQAVFDALFQKLCRAVLIEGMLIAVVVALYSSGLEQFARTWHTVYTSRRGRYIQREKFLTGLLYTVTMYGILALASSVVFAAFWRLGEIWTTHMSTQFYAVYSMGMRLPFIPWADGLSSMRGCLAAVLLLGMVLAVAFYLFGYLAGLLAKNSYVGFLSVCLLCALNFELIMLAGNAGRWGIYEAAMWTPAAFLGSHSLWFTDMGINAVIPWQECAVAALCLVQAAVLLSCGFRHYYRKDF